MTTPEPTGPMTDTPADAPTPFAGWDGTFAELMTGEPSGTDRFTSPTARYPWGRVYGGQVVAQALWAAGQTVEEQYQPHSLHAYFIRGGDSNHPIDFEVERTRDGRSFITRHVLGYQFDKVMLEMTSSFHRPEPNEAGETAVEMTLPAPSTLSNREVSPWTPFFDRMMLPSERGRASMWARFVEDVPDTPLMRACAIAFVSDDVPTEAVLNLHPNLRNFDWYANVTDIGDRFMSASLDHALWFHEIGDPMQWQLHDFRSEIVGNARGMSHGRIFSESGALLATAMQEVLLRERR